MKLKEFLENFFLFSLLFIGMVFIVNFERYLVVFGLFFEYEIIKVLFVFIVEVE